jgi:hypothetical protein
LDSALFVEQAAILPQFHGTLANDVSLAAPALNLKKAGAVLAAPVTAL